MLASLKGCLDGRNLPPASGRKILDVLHWLRTGGVHILPPQLS